MSDTEQKVEAPVKVRKPMDENRLSQLAAARELAVKARSFFYIKHLKSQF